MDSGLIITTVLGILTIYLMIYIAFRQGIFKRPKLSATTGIYGTLGTQIWSIVVGIKDMNTEDYVVLVPYIIENRGDIALKEILVQFFYDKEFDSSIFDFFDPKWNEDKIFNYNINRTVKHIYNTILVEYHIPLLSPKSPLYLQEPIVIKKSKFNKSKTNFANKILEKSSDKKYIIEKLKCNISAENHAPLELNTWLIITPSNDMAELKERTDWPTWKLFYHICPKFFGRFMARREGQWAPPPMFPLCKKFLLYVQPKFLTIKDGKKMVSIQNIHESEFQLGIFDMNHYIPVKI